MSWPYVSAEIAFATDPFSATPLFWGCSRDLLGFVARRGRPDEMSAADAGISDLTLDNSDRRYEPFYPGSPLYPNVKPMRLGIVEAVWPRNIFRPANNSAFQLGNTSGYRLLTSGLGTILAGGAPGGELEVARGSGGGATSVDVQGDFIPVAENETFSFLVTLRNQGLQAGTQSVIRWWAYDAKKNKLGGDRGLSSFTMDGAAYGQPSSGFDLPTNANQHVFGGQITTPPGTYYVRFSVVLWSTTTSARDVKVTNFSLRPGITTTAYEQGVVYRRLTGWAAPEEWPPDWNLRSSTVELGVADGFVMVNKKKVYRYFGPASAGARINSLLDRAGFPSGGSFRNIYAGESYGGLQEVTLDGEYAGAHIQEAADSDMGAFFFDHLSRACFESRAVRRAKTPVAVFSDDPGGGEYPYIASSGNTGPLLNNVTVRLTNEAGEADFTPADTATLTTKLRQYGPQEQEYNPIVQLGVEGQAQVDYRFWRYMDSDGLRINSIALDPRRDDTFWAVFLSLKLGDKITVKKTNVPGGGAPIRHDAIIEGIEETVLAPVGQPPTWMIVLQLSKVVSEPWGIVNTSTLDGTAVLGL